MAESVKLKKREFTLEHRLALSAAHGGNVPIIDRVMRKVTKTESCWHWNGYKDKDGYGLFSTFVLGKGQAEHAHRIVYKHLKGDIPTGLVLDHLCRVRHCVNPDHLEAVTALENTRRGIRATKTHCVNGHEFNKENTRIYSGTSRRCLLCSRDRNREYRIRRSAK